MTQMSPGREIGISVTSGTASSSVLATSSTVLICQEFGQRIGIEAGEREIEVLILQGS